MCYGTWGSFMFGHASMDWSNTGLSLMAVFRYMMYDYNLDSMASSFPTMANVFYISMMLLLTNMVLWMFLAIVLESYTEVRARSHGAPSLLDDAASAWVALPRAAALLHAASCGRCGEPSAGLADVIDALRGRLRAEEEVTAVALAAGVPYLRADVAEELILDAAAWSASAEGGGGADEGGAPEKGGAGGGGRHRRAFWMARDHSGATAAAGAARHSYSEVRAAAQRSGSFLSDGGEHAGAGAGAGDAGGGGGGGGGAAAAAAAPAADALRARAAALAALLGRAGEGAAAAVGAAELEELVGEAARFIAAAELARRGAAGK